MQLLNVAVILIFINVSSNYLIFQEREKFGYKQDHKQRGVFVAFKTWNVASTTQQG